MRREALIKMYKQKMVGDADTHSPFLGQSVCKSAFLLLTGSGSWSLTHARGAAQAGNESSLSMKELNCCLDIKNTNKPALYLDARMWLLHYADIAGDHSPMEVETFLPQGRKSCYYWMYRNNRQSLGLEFASQWLTIDLCALDT